MKLTMPRISFGSGNYQRMVCKISKLHGVALPIGLGAVALLAVSRVILCVAESNGDVLVASQSVDESTSVTVDPAATVADASTKIIQESCRNNR